MNSYRFEWVPPFRVPKPSKPISVINTALRDDFWRRLNALIIETVDDVLAVDTWENEGGAS